MTYDTIIIGAGPAGLSAALYSARYLMKTLVLSVDVGGQLLLAHKIENYPGMPDISGFDMVQVFKKQAEAAGAEFVSASIENMRKEGDEFVIDVGTTTYRGKSLILTQGSQHRKLDIPGEHEMIGKGVSYCATCDAAFFRNQTIAIVGGGNSAFTGIEIATQYATKVYLIHRRKDFRAEPTMVKRVLANPKVEAILENEVVEVVQSPRLEKVLLKNPHNGSTELAIGGLFIEIGFDPSSKLGALLSMELDPEGLIVVNPDQSTNVPGGFAAGDLTTSSNKFKQITTAVSEGSIAADSAFRYLKAKGALNG